MPNSHVATTYVAEVTHICVTNIRESQSSLHFTPRASLFELQAIWGNCTECPPNDCESSNVKGTSYVLLVSTRPNLSPSHFATSCFRDTGHFETSAPNDSKMNLNTTRLMYLIYVLPVSMGPKFYPVSFYDQPLSRYRPFWDKFTDWA